MIKSDAEKPEPGKVTVPHPEALVSYLKFPIDLEQRKVAEKIAAKDRIVRDFERNIEEYRRYIADYKRRAKTHKTELKKLQEVTLDTSVIKPEDAVKEVESLAKLSWVENVRVENDYLMVTTRRGVLKTTLDTRIVDPGTGGGIVEFMKPPITVELPQYEIGVGLKHLGSDLANDTSRLAIRLISEKDTNPNAFVGGKVGVYEPHPHWASSGAGRRLSWEKLCLGDYEKDIRAASLKGLVPLFVELANYLQTSGDDHAYRKKEFWAMWLGKPEYKDFCIRKIEEGESVESVRERFREDFKIYRKVEVNAGSIATPLQDAEPVFTTNAFAWAGDVMPLNQITGRLTVDTLAVVWNAANDNLVPGDPLVAQFDGTEPTPF